MSDHDPTTCPRCHAAQLIVDALDIINPDDCRIEWATTSGCGKLRMAVWSDDCGSYAATVTVEVTT